MTRLQDGPDRLGTFRELDTLLRLRTMLSHQRQARRSIITRRLDENKWAEYAAEDCESRVHCAARHDAWHQQRILPAPPLLHLIPGISKPIHCSEACCAQPRRARA